jgi:hypothetical protein
MIKPKIFLLGGYDLEMLTIKDLLLDNGYIENINIFDQNLSWGAKLSTYNYILGKAQNSTIYGIELVEDIQTPNNYIAIDHHYENDNLPSSLEQIAKILNIKLNRYQKLIAANDAKYILGMKALGASKNEITEIRKKDRTAQGVSEKDEFLAEEAIANKKIQNDIAIIKSKTSKFSPIIDRLYEKHKQLLIYTDVELCYYGIVKTQTLINKYHKLLLSHNAYYGGNKSYFGITNKLTQTKYTIEHYVREIIDL